MQNLLQKTYELLKKDDRLISTEGDLLKNKIQELSYKLDEKLIDLLYSDETIRGKFFKKINEVWLFDSNRFVKFINNKEFLPDSYTAFKNKIGLVDSKEEFIADKNDVVLNRPYKDCILAGGQDTEDAKRDEIFYNEVLASDEIDRLLDPKVFTNFKKYNKDGEHEFTERTKDENGDIKDNMIIKGNNLLVLHSLKKKFAGKVKLIYIDPPYNTGNDGFKYNDKFNHSTWLTFMKNRLEVAKELLREDGSIFVSIDNKEMPYLKVLMDDIFGRENFRNNVVWKKLTSAKSQSKFLSNITEFILFYSKTDRIDFYEKYLETDIEQDKKNYQYIEENTGRRYGSFDFTQKGQGESRLFGDKRLDPPTGKHRIWSQDKINEGIKNNLIIFTKNGMPRLKRYLDDKKGNYLSDLRNDNEVSTISANDKERLYFDGQKPEALIKRILEISTKEGDLVLDYHAGTGTTGAVSHKMGRKWILVEQMDYIKDLPQERMKNVIKGDDVGISKIQNRQGGGDFVYMEMLENNKIWIDKIVNSKNKSDLLVIYDRIKTNIYINYKFDISIIDSHIQEFNELSLENMKIFLKTIIEKNSLYVNYSEMNDVDFNVKKADKEINSIFYN